jgi:YHS domain-containing protein
MFQKISLVISVVVLGMLFLCGCNRPSEEPGQVETSVHHRKAAANVAQTAQNAVQAAFEKMKSTSFAAAMVLDGKPIGKFEQKGTSWRVDLGGKVYYFFDGTKNKLFDVNTDLKTAKEMAAADLEKIKIGTPVQAFDGLDKLSWTESADKAYWESKSADGKTSYKCYLGADGLPVKLETTADGKVSTNEWTISNVGTVADADLSIPADFKVTELAPTAPKPGEPAAGGQAPKQPSKEAPKTGDNKGAATK